MNRYLLELLLEYLYSGKIEHPPQPCVLSSQYQCWYYNRYTEVGQPSRKECFASASLLLYTGNSYNSLIFNEAMLKLRHAQNNVDDTKLDNIDELLQIVDVSSVRMTLWVIFTFTSSVCDPSFWNYVLFFGFSLILSRYTCSSAHWIFWIIATQVHWW